MGTDSTPCLLSALVEGGGVVGGLNRTEGFCELPRLFQVELRHPRHLLPKIHKSEEFGSHIHELRFGRD